MFLIGAVLQCPAGIICIFVAVLCLLSFITGQKIVNQVLSRRECFFFNNRDLPHVHFTRLVIWLRVFASSCDWHVLFPLIAVH